MNANITKSQVELWQGETDNGRPFGFVHGDDGGLFFTWMDTLEETIGTLEACEIDGDGELDESEVAEFLREYLPTTKQGQNLWASDEE